MNYTLLVSCEHAVNTIPDEFIELFTPHSEILDTHAAYDIGALMIAETLAKTLNLPLFQAPISRLLVDFNRCLHHPLSFSFISRKLPKIKKRQIIETYYQPYRESVIQTIQTQKPVLHLSIHSFTPVLNEVPRNADIGLLYDPSRLIERNIAIQWQQLLQHHAPQLLIRRNYPYLGHNNGLTTFLRKQFPMDDYLGFEIEINQAKLMDIKDQEEIVLLLTMLCKSITESFS